MSRKKAKMLFWAALVVLAYIPYLMQSCQPRRHVASGYATAETHTGALGGEGSFALAVGCGERLASCSWRPPVGGFKAAAGGTGTPNPRAACGAVSSLSGKLSAIP